MVYQLIVNPNLQIPLKFSNENCKKCDHFKIILAFLVIFWPNKCLLSTKRCSFEFKDNTSYSVLVIPNLLISLVPYFKAKMALIFCIYVFCPKGGFFSESALCFLDLQISKKIFQKNYPELEIQISSSG